MVALGKRLNHQKNKRGVCVMKTRRREVIDGREGSLAKRARLEKEDQDVILTALPTLLEMKQIILSSRDFSQTPLLQRLNVYLQSKGQSFLSILPEPDENESTKSFSVARAFPFRGHCHGLTLTWLRKMNDGLSEWFYSTKEKIITYSLEEMKDIEVDIEKLLAQIQWAQHSEEYEPSITQESLKEILDAETMTLSWNKFNVRGLFNYLLNVNEDGNMIYIKTNNLQLKCHTVGVYIENRNTWFFDANHESGRAYIVKSVYSLVEELQASLYEKIGVPVPFLMELIIGIARGPAFKAKPHPVKFFSKSDKVNRNLLDELDQMFSDIQKGLK